MTLLNLPYKTDAEILEIAGALLDDVNGGAETGDFGRHVKDFTPRLMEMVDEEGFRRMAAEMLNENGKATSRFAAGVFRRSDSILVIWGQSHEKNADTLAVTMALIEDVEGRVMIDHLQIL